MRTWCVALLLGAAACSHGSYELFLIPSADGRVSRIDPVSRVGLGSFGPSTPAQVTSSSSGIWVLNSTGRYARYNFSTGAILNQSSVIPAFTSNAIAGSDSNSLTGIVGNTIRDFNLLTGTTKSLATLNLSYTYAQIERLPNGIFVVMAKNNANIKFVCETYAPGGTLIDSVQLAQNVFDSIGQMAITGSGTTYRAHAFYGTGGGNPTPWLSSITITSAGLISGSTGVSIPGTTWTAGAEPATVASHDGLWVVGLNSASNIQVSQLSLSPSVAVVDSYTFPHKLPSSRWTMVNVLAPEPAGLLALTVPFVGLLARKKKRPSEVPVRS